MVEFLFTLRNTTTKLPQLSAVGTKIVNYEFNVAQVHDHLYTDGRPLLTACSDGTYIVHGDSCSLGTLYSVFLGKVGMH